ncbi:MAG: Holliday junction resolvase RuvX [Candidatus Lindowbacteria bacterium]|nr:Holliday junction resolvase RuvX [Candidatus Lindowbacteria bacterium]
MHKRILGVDVGDKRIGLAVSDELGITAQPLGTIERTQTSDDFKKVVEAAENCEAGLIVLGLPMKLDGSSSPQTEKVQRFIQKLGGYTAIPIDTWDERFTTATAEASLIEANVRRKARRKVIDSAAAQIMLQHYLDCQRRKN